MAAATRPPTYRNPRFVLNHLARDIGSFSALAPVTLDTPEGRLRDDQADRPVRFTPVTGAKQMLVDRGILPARRGTNRTIIPGHNFFAANGGYVDIRSGDGPGSMSRVVYSAATATTRRPLECGGPPGGRPVDVEHGGDFHTRADNCDTRFMETYVRGDQVVSPELGEIVFGTIIQASTGVARQFRTQPRKGTIQTSRMIGGEKYATVLGGEERAWVLRHVGCSEVDKRLVYEPVNDAYQAGRAFWYDPPESGDVNYIRFRMNDAAEWTGYGGASVAVIARNDQREASYADPLTEFGIQITTDGSATVAQGARSDEADHFPDGAEDWTGLYISVDWVARTTAPAWLVNNDDLRLRVYSNSDLNRSSAWGIGRGPISALAPFGPLFRCWVDPTAAPDQVGSAGPANMSRVTAVSIECDPDASQAWVMEFQKIALHDPTKGVRQVMLDGPLRFTQDGGHPAHEVTWTIEGTLVETLA